MICFDIETGPLPKNDLVRLMPPFDPTTAVPDPGDFDPSSVKTGNLKDPDKIAAKVAEAKQAHAAACASIKQRREQAAADYFAAFEGKAALSAITGRVLAIGIYVSEYRQGSIELWTVAKDHDEASLIGDFFRVADNALNRGESIVGHNIHGFDLPFLVRRAWLLGIDVPDGFYDGRYWNRCFVDTMRVWQLGTREYISLDDIDKALGGPGKPDGVTGADFDRLFHGTKEERDQALEYLRNDVRMTVRVANALQIL